MAAVTEWLRDEYLAALCRPAGSRRYVSFLRGLARAPGRPAGVGEMLRFLQVKAAPVLPKTGVTCAALRVSYPSEAEGVGGAVFAYVYWAAGCEASRPTLACVSPTYVSQDGEYRYPLAPYDEYEAEAEPHRRDAELEALLARAGAELSAEVHPAECREVVLRQLEGGVYLALLTRALFSYQDIRRGNFMIHLNSNYVRFILRLAEHAPERWSLLPAAGEAAAFRRAGAQLGQKVIPLSVGDISAQHDEFSAVWRELFITELAGDLALNGVTPSVAIFGQWTILEGFGPASFDNESMVEKYANSGKVLQASEKLRLVSEELAPLSGDRYVGSFVRRLQQDIQFAFDRLVLTPYALMYTVEHVGITLFSTPGLVRFNRFYNEAVRIDSAERVAARLFEYCYAALCLHARLGVMHGDPHGNNLTVAVLPGHGEPKGPPNGPPKHNSGPPKPNSHDHDQGQGVNPAHKGRRPARTPEFAPDTSNGARVAYALGPDESETYVFPAEGTRGYLIDYSRSLLGPGSREWLDANNHPGYADDLFRRQAAQVAATVVRHLPNTMERHARELEELALTRWAELFPVVCTLDFVVIARAVSDFAERESAYVPNGAEVGPFSVSADALRYTRKLERLAIQRVLRDLRGLLAGGGPREPPPFAGAELIAAVFGEWAYPRWAAGPGAVGAHLAELYCFDAPLRYGCSEYARYPPWARLAELRRRGSAADLATLGLRDPTGLAPAVVAELSAESEALADVTATAALRSHAELAPPPDAWSV